jgi:fructokinase
MSHLRDGRSVLVPDPRRPASGLAPGASRYEQVTSVHADGKPTLEHSMSGRHGVGGMTQHRIGIDLGGTKIEIAVLGTGGTEVLRRRIQTPSGYPATVQAIADLVRDAEAHLGVSATVGIGIPGVISPATGLVKGANSIALNGHPFDVDVSRALAREVRVENDANCFALSEATAPPGRGFGCVFGVILGTGCGGGIVMHGQVHGGPHRVAGEWGHTPLPWATPEEYPGNLCWCGRHGCLETYLSGPGLARDCDGPQARDASDLPTRAATGDPAAGAALARHVDRLARGLAVVIDILDPDAIVLGGGLSNLDHLYAELPRLLPVYAFSDVIATPILRNVHGDSSGVRGAAALWPPD